MKTFTTLKNLFGSLSQNTSSTNLSLGGQLISDQHRYLIQKYFDNERSYQTTTVGGQSVTATATIASGATSATLTASWSNPTVKQLVNFSNGDQRTVLFTNGSTAISWTGGLSSSATTVLTSVGVQAYAIPANISKIIDSTISVGQLKYTAAPVQTRYEWDLINTLPYTSNITNYFFIYNGNVEFFPIPSSSGLIIQFNYKSRVPDLSFADYSTGTLSGITALSTSITGVGSNWNSSGNYPLNTDLSFFNLFLNITPPSGEGIWYPISQFASNTAMTLATPIQNAPSATASAYTIGQLPLLSEDFHDMLVFGALKIYFSSIVKDESKYNQYDAMYKERLALLEDYAGTKQVNVDLGGPIMMDNPNLYNFSNTSTNLP